MPVEIIKESPDRNSEPQVEVRWGPDQFNTIQLVVDRGEKFVFITSDGGPLPEEEGEPDSYTGLAISLDRAEDVNTLIKALQRAKRKTFK